MLGRLSLCVYESRHPSGLRCGHAVRRTDLVSGVFRETFGALIGNTEWLSKTISRSDPVCVSAESSRQSQTGATSSEKYCVRYSASYDVAVRHGRASLSITIAMTKDLAGVLRLSFSTFNTASEHQNPYSEVASSITADDFITIRDF